MTVTLWIFEQKTFRKNINLRPKPSVRGAHQHTNTAYAIPKYENIARPMVPDLGLTKLIFWKTLWNFTNKRLQVYETLYKTNQDRYYYCAGTEIVTSLQSAVRSHSSCLDSDFRRKLTDRHNCYYHTLHLRIVRQLLQTPFQLPRLLISLINFIYCYKWININ